MNFLSLLKPFFRESFNELAEPVSSGREMLHFIELKGKKRLGVKVYYGNDAFVGVN